MNKPLRFRTVIDSETKADYVAVEQLHKAVFPGKNIPQLVKAIRKTPTFNQKASIVARVKGAVVGHVLFSSLQFENDGDMQKNAAFLAPIAVDTAYQQHLIGSKLIQAALQKAAELGYDSMYVIGSDSFYAQFGFTPVQTVTTNIELHTPQLLLVHHFNDKTHLGNLQFAVDETLLQQLFE